MMTRAKAVRSVASVFALASLAACSGAASDASSGGEDELATASSGPTGTTPAAGSAVQCDVLVVGGSVAGVSAALASSRIGLKTCVTEETDWIGGQFTSQGLNASDDSQYTDSIGSTQSFQKMRSLMRAEYNNHANPGNCWVSYVCAEPKAALGAIASMLNPAVSAGILRVFYGVKPTAVSVADGRVNGVTMTRTADNGTFTISAKQTVDATDLGDVIALSGTAYRLGQEPQSDTGEHDAPAAGCTDCVQAFTFDVVLEKRPDGENHVIPKPAGYGVDPWMKGYSLNSFPMYGKSSFWEYRRIVDGAANGGGNDLAIINWDTNDYPFGNIVDKSPDQVALHLQRARLRSLGFVYWLQTEADGHGYPNLLLRTDVLGRSDGTAKTAYYREGRRLKALETIRVEDVSNAYISGARARQWDDSVGVGFYPLDMHQNSATGTGFPSGKSLPFEIPLGALIPETMDGLVAAGKDIGTSHMANSSYRLHPVEWASGEAAGTFAALCASWGIEPRAAYADEGKVRETQRVLTSAGAPLYWTSDVKYGDKNWADVQLAAASSVMSADDDSTLAWHPTAAVNRAQAAAALVAALGLEVVTPDSPSFADVPADFWAYGAIETLAAKGLISGTGNGDFSPSAPVTFGQMRAILDRATSANGGSGQGTALVGTTDDATSMTRSDTAHATAGLYKWHLGIK